MCNALLHACPLHGERKKKGTENVNMYVNVARNGKKISYSQNVQNA